jgi:hypothetical protein
MAAAPEGAATGLKGLMARMPSGFQPTVAGQPAAFMDAAKQGLNQGILTGGGLGAALPGALEAMTPTMPKPEEYRETYAPSTPFQRGQIAAPEGYQPGTSGERRFFDRYSVPTPARLAGGGMLSYTPAGMDQPMRMQAGGIADMMPGAQPEMPPMNGGEVSPMSRLNAVGDRLRTEDRLIQQQLAEEDALREQQFAEQIAAFNRQQAEGAASWQQAQDRRMESASSDPSAELEQIRRQMLEGLSPQERQSFFDEALESGMVTPLRMLVLAYDRRRRQSEGFAIGGMIEGPGTGIGDMMPGMMPPEMMMPGAQPEMPPMNDKDLVNGAISAIKGEMPEQTAAVVLGQFLQRFGEEAFRKLVDDVQSGRADASGGDMEGTVRGPGDGMDDLVPATMDDGSQDVLLSDGEFIVPADVVSGLGNGSTDAGAEELHRMMDRVRRERTGRTEQARQVAAGGLMPA